MNNQNKAHSQKQRRNTRIFAVLMLISQTAFSILYSFLYSVGTQVVSTTAVLNAALMALLVTVGTFASHVGFGLVLSYLKRLIWSGLGFTLFITAFSIQFYPLVNYLWRTANIHANAYQQGEYVLFLSNSQLPADKSYGNCLSNCFKCALAIVAAFSSILGRAGALECYIVTVVGTVGFQLNRQLVMNLGADRFGTFFIFTFGGFMGLALGGMLRLLKEKVSKGSSTAKNIFNQSSLFNSALAMFGSIVIFALFPVLAYDMDSSRTFDSFLLHTAPVSVLLAMAASLMAAYIASSAFNGDVIARDLLHAPIAGGIMVGSAASFIANPVYALVAGFTAGTVQTIIQNCIELPWMKQKAVISAISWSLFGVQGLLGGIFASAYKKIIQSSSATFTFTNISFNAGEELLMAVISAGMGLAFGITSGLIILLVSRHKSRDFFVDRTYWIFDDGLAFPQNKVENAGKASKKASQIQQPAVLQADPIPAVSVVAIADIVAVEPDQLSQDSQKGKQSVVRIEYSQVIPFDVSTPNFQMSFSQPQQPEKKHAFL